MTVYVDNMKAKYGRLILCHMVADTLEELHTMTDKIGVNRKWFQDKNIKHLHYDISLGKKELAILYGAKEISMRDIVKIKTIMNIDEISKHE